MISEQAGRALNLIQSIRLSKDADAGFWRELVTRIVIDLDEVAAERDVTRIADLLAVAHGRLADTPDGTEAGRCALRAWTLAARAASAGSRSCPATTTGRRCRGM